MPKTATKTKGATANDDDIDSLLDFDDEPTAAPADDDGDDLDSLLGDDETAAPTDMPKRPTKAYLKALTDAEVTKLRLATDLNVSQKKAITAEADRRREAAVAAAEARGAAAARQIVTAKSAKAKSAKAKSAKADDGDTPQPLVDEVEIASLTFPKGCHPSDDSPRYSKESIAELWSSIKKHGLYYPIHVARSGSKLEVIAGKRRTMAYQHGKRKTVPALVVDVNGEDAAHTKHLKAIRAFVDNAERADLSPLEKAELLGRMQRGKTALDVSAVAKLAGRSKTWVTRLNQIAALKGDDREAVADMGFQAAVDYAVAAGKKKAKKPEPATTGDKPDKAPALVPEGGKRRGAKRKRVQLIGDSPVNNPRLDDQLDEAFPSVVVERTGDDTFALELTVCVGEFTSKELKSSKSTWAKAGLSDKVIATATALTSTRGYASALRNAVIGGIEHLQQ